MAEVTREFRVARPVEDTWNFFITPETVAPCVPGCVDVEELEEDVFNAKIEVKVAYTSLTFDTRIELTDKQPPNSAKVEAKAEPSGRMPGSATVDGDLSLEADGDETVGEIGIEFAIRGRLGSLGESAFRHKCEEMTDRFIDNMKTELEENQALAE
ncbi:MULTISPECIES: CoxG family protein [unclassified Haladaptatus]|uniref:CoxG family protein n=1 Tax=unclassified Haladaptatus TaxID=2622732 RepID=UPI002FCE4F32